MSRPSPDLLLTGATGFLGHFLLAELLREPHARCRVLLRPPLSASLARLTRLLAVLGMDVGALIAADRIVLVEGELPDMLNRADLAGIDTVVHAAGHTGFDATAAGEPVRTNVDGTRALLSMADDLGVRRFLLISTAYVCGDRTGCVPETVSATPPPFRNDYERSKWEAEQLVWRWGTGSRVAAICRPSILFGDRATGRATTMAGLYVIARATEILSRAANDDPEVDRHRIPLRILGRADATANVVPVDWAAERIASIALERASAASVYHVTNPDPPTHLEIKGWLEEYFDIGGGTFSDSAWPLEAPNHYEGSFYALGNILRDYFRHGLTFESGLAGQRPGAERLVDRAGFFRCLRYAQETNWGRSRGKERVAHPPPRRIDPKWYFEEFLPQTLPRSKIAQVNALTATVRFTITGSSACEWVCRFNQGRLAEVQGIGNHLSEEFEYRLPYEDFASAVTCRTPLQQVFFHGGAEMLGNLERALKMVPIMGEFLKEFPVTES